MTRNQSQSNALEQLRAEECNSRQHPSRLTLWVDGVGGFLMLDREELLVGQAIAGSQQDIGILGDLSRQAAVLKRIESDYVLQPLQATWVNGTLTTVPYLLGTSATIGWGERVRLEFTKPHPLSSSARLSLSSLHRFQPRVDGIVLLADSCILGVSPTCHVQCPSWSQDLLMFRSGQKWYFRAVDEVEVNGQPQKGQVPVVSGLRVRGPDFSFSVE